MDGIVRKHIVFKGDVQGVGFRFRAYYAAQAFGVTGWVRNEWDGTVEMEAEGRARDIDEMTKKVADGRFISIEDMEVREIPAEGDRSFRVL